MNGGIYDRITGLNIGSPESSIRPEATTRQGETYCLHEVLNEDIFRQVLQHFPSVRSRVLLSHVCHSWRHYVCISWSSVEIIGPDLPRQLSWIRKQPCQNVLQELKIAGRRSGNAQLLRLDLAQTLGHFTQLRALNLCPKGGFAVTQQHIRAMAGLAELTSLQAQYTLPNVHQDADLEEFAALTGLKHLDIAFVQPAAASLSSSLGALTCLTFLALDRLLSLKQEGGCSGGALSSLLLRLCCLNLQVAGDLDLEMRAPCLESLRLTCGQAACREPAQLPQLRCLYQESPRLRALDLLSCRNLQRIETGTFCTVSRSHINALGRCAALEELSISHYVPDPGPFSLEEFACLTGLKCLDLSFTAHGNKYYMAPGLCMLEHLTSLSLCPSTESSLCGSIEHAPNLKRLKLTSTSQSSLLHSKSLTSLTVGSHNGYGYAPEEVVSIGAFPALEELHLSDMLEGDAGPGGAARSRFHMPHSLTRLQVMTVDLAYCTAADPLTTRTPRDPDDITRLLAGISRLCPNLKALKVTAMRRAVAVDPMQMPLQHLALACRELTLARAVETPDHDVDRSCRSIPASLHFLFVTAPHETVKQLADWGADRSLISSGDLYLNRELQEWKRGGPHPNDLATHAAFGSLQTVYDNGFYL